MTFNFKFSKKFKDNPEKIGGPLPFRAKTDSTAEYSEEKTSRASKGIRNVCHQKSWPPVPDCGQPVRHQHWYYRILIHRIIVLVERSRYRSVLKN